MESARRRAPEVVERIGRPAARRQASGGEAFCADTGDFGLRLIRRASMAAVLPSLVLAYLGQGAVILEDPAAATNPF